MRIDIITLAPDLLKSPFEHSMMKRAIEKDLAEIHFHNLRDYGIGQQDLPTLAQGAMLQTRLLMNNPRTVTYEDALGLYQQAW